ncbi:MAG: DUF2065 family protein [Pseudomonadales bacterium]
MWHDLAVAVCLVLVLEGLMPFISPAGWRQALASLAQASDRTVRTIGLLSMLAGASMLYLLR